MLREAVGWKDREVHLTLAHGALALLDEPDALAHLEAALEASPGWEPAVELKRLIEAGEAPTRDLHAGHDHD